MKTEIIGREERLAIAIDIANSLSFLHANKIVHRGVTSESVFIDKYHKQSDERRTFLPRARLGKFSSARILFEPANIRFNINTGTYHCFAEKIGSCLNSVTDLNYFDISTASALAEDVAGFGRLLTSLFVTMDTSDKLVSNWPKKGFVISN